MAAISGVTFAPGKDSAFPGLRSLRKFDFKHLDAGVGGHLNQSRFRQTTVVVSYSVFSGADLKDYVANAKTIVVVQDNLNIHCKASL